MEAFFAIVLSIFLISKFGRSKTKRTAAQELNRNTVKARWDRKRIKAEKLKQEEKLARKLEKNKRKEAEELITVIIPTIQNDGK